MTSSTGFLNSLHRSGLLSPEETATYETLFGDGPDLAQALVGAGLLSQYQADRLLAGKWKYLIRGKYKVLDRLGSGGLSTVFLAEHRFIRKRVALKVIRPEEAADRACLARLYREARLLAQLDHPNLIRIYDIEHINDEHFLVMECVDGENLRDVVKRDGPLTVSEAVRVIREVALGLQQVHERGLLHRDIKPGNILRGPGGQVKLIDFSLSRCVHDTTDQITIRYSRDAFLGTADFAAPEQFRSSQDVDARSDLYGLGATLYYLLTGRPPYPAEQFADKRKAHESKPLTSIRLVRPEVPEGLAQVVAKMMAKDRARRFQTAQEVAEALAPWLPTLERRSAADTMVGDECRGVISDAVIPLANGRPPGVIWTTPPVANLFPCSSTEPVARQNLVPGAASCMSELRRGLPLPPRWRWAGVALSTILGAATALTVWYAYLTL